MTPEEFRRIALEMPGAAEGSHMGHADFRVGGKIFASLWPDGEHGMVKLTPGEQREFESASPGVFEAVKGAWGRRGCTRVRLEEAGKREVRAAMMAAWRSAAPGAPAEWE